MYFAPVMRIRMFLGLLNPDPDPSIIKKKHFKKLNSNATYCFVTFYGFFIFEIYVNVPSKNNKQKILKTKYFLLRLKGQRRK
jgi:hypothetical protein